MLSRPLVLRDDRCREVFRVALSLSLCLLLPFLRIRADSARGVSLLGRYVHESLLTEPDLAKRRVGRRVIDCDVAENVSMIKNTHVV